MPFELQNSDAAFNRVMHKLLKGSKNTNAYVDDVLGHTRY